MMVRSGGIVWGGVGSELGGGYRSCGCYLMGLWIRVWGCGLSRGGRRVGGRGVGSGEVEGGWSRRV